MSTDWHGQGRITGLAAASAIEHMCIDHRRLGALVAQDLLDCPKICIGGTGRWPPQSAPPGSSHQLSKSPALAIQRQTGGSVVENPRSLLSFRPAVLDYGEPGDSV